MFRSRLPLRCRSRTPRRQIRARYPPSPEYTPCPVVPPKPLYVFNNDKVVVAPRPVLVVPEVKPKPEPKPRKNGISMLKDDAVAARKRILELETELSARDKELSVRDNELEIVHATKLRLHDRLQVAWVWPSTGKRHWATSKKEREIAGLEWQSSNILFEQSIQCDFQSH